MPPCNGARACVVWCAVCLADARALLRRRSIDRALAAAERGRDDVIARATVCACVRALQRGCDT